MQSDLRSCPPSLTSKGGIISSTHVTTYIFHIHTICLCFKQDTVFVCMLRNICGATNWPALQCLIVKYYTRMAGSKRSSRSFKMNEKHFFSVKTVIQIHACTYARVRYDRLTSLTGHRNECDVYPCEKEEQGIFP